MKILIPLILLLSLGLLGAGTVSLFSPAPVSQPAPQPQTLPASTLTSSTMELAKPLIGRVFTSTCTLDKGHSYRESLEFSAEGVTRFSRRSFNDTECQNPASDTAIREGRYALEPEEEGRLLLIVRNLQGQKAQDATPYFEALIHIDHNQLVLDNAPSPAQQYTAI